jgi:hypothetical protein
MTGETIRKVQEASAIGSIQCAPAQCARCVAAANEGLTTGLKEILAKLEAENERGVITDTLWYSDHETLFDFIGSLIEGGGA